MKKLSTKHKIALVELVVIIAILFWLFGPKSFDAAMAFDFDADQVTSVTAVLSNEPAGKEEITVTVDPSDLTYEQIVSVLDATNYKARGSGGLSQAILTDYKVELTFHTDGDQHTIRMVGNTYMDFYGNQVNNDAPRAFQPSDPSIQQTVHDLLLAAAG